jgi:DNA helicase IV
MGESTDIVDLARERAALAEARDAVAAKLERLRHIEGGGADALTDEYIASVVEGAVEKLQQELVVFGRIDDDHPWRVGLYGIDRGGDQLVVDWRAPFAGGFYQATFDEPLGLRRRTSYVGCIDDLFVEDFVHGEVHGSSPLMAELSRSRGETMRAAVATLQSEQDRLVRLDPSARLVLRGGPGTGKTVVGLHRAAWLVYNDRRITADRILVIGPSDRFLRFVATVLPTLGEARIVQTTFGRLLGPSPPGGDDEQWIDALDLLEASLVEPRAVKVGGRRVAADDVAELAARLGEGRLPWRDRRRIFVERLAGLLECSPGDAGRAAADVWPTCTARQATDRLRRLGAELGLTLSRGAVEGGLGDEIRARFEGVPARYSHVIVDEAQDMTLLELRAVQRRSDGLTLVGDDAQRNNPAGVGLRRAASLLTTELHTMATAYRMSAEIADWLNAHARANAMEAVELIGIRPNGIAVRELPDGDPATESARFKEAWPNVATIDAASVWDHKGVEYDGVVVDRRGMAPADVYLAASRAAHELVLVGE